MRLLLLSGTFFLAAAACAQNLVQNPGFEQWSDPQGYYVAMQNGQVPGWYDPGNYSSDFYRANGNSYDYTTSIGGTMKAHAGTAFAGFLGQYGSNYREHVGGTLVSPMQKGVTYLVRFYLALGPGCLTGVKELGIHFTETDYSNATGVNYLHYEHPGDYSYGTIGNGFNHDFSMKPQVQIRNLDYDSYAGQWREITLEYTASGGERYFIVGNFNDDAHSEKTSPVNVHPGSLAWCYFYIDDFSIRPKETIVTEILPSPFLVDTMIGPWRTCTAKNIVFSPGQSTLKKEAGSTLVRIACAMRRQPALRLEITWYETQGPQALAEARAKAIACFLVTNGIAAERISVKGISLEKIPKYPVEFAFTE